MNPEITPAAQNNTGATEATAQTPATEVASSQSQTQATPQAEPVLGGGGQTQGQTQAQAQPGNWLDSLPQDLRGHEVLKDIQDPAALAKAFVEAKGKVPQVPAEYAINAPEGAKVDAAVAGAAKTLAKEIGLTQAQLDALVRFDANRAQVFARSEAEATNQGFEALKAELGTGAEPYFAQAKQGYQAFASPELRALVEGKGLQNHPGLIRHFHAIGALVQEGKLPMGPGAGRKKSLAEVLYPDNK